MLFSIFLAEIEGEGQQHTEGGHEGLSLSPDEIKKEEMELEEENEHYQPLILLFVFVGLLLGGLLREVYTKTKIPYTPMLIVAGIIMGHWATSLGAIGESTIILSHINPHILLFVFIPVLIFESAFNCEWFIFKRSLVNILLLAVPGVLFGALLISIIFKIFLGYGDEDMTWFGALMAGSILSCTDPVAVVALFKELGANPRFGHLVEGESLLNDGTAMVFYQLFLVLTKSELGTSQGEPPTASSVLISFVRQAGGGPLLGLTIGLISSFWLRRVIRDDVLTSTITFFTCYIVFFCAEFTFLHVSGILSIVVLGLFMSAFGKTSIYSESEHAVWAFTQFGCETLIFLLTGVLIGIQMIEKSTITSSDWVKLIFFYILSVVARTIMCGCLYPLLSKFGYGLTKEQFIVLVWGGLRGALGLTLSLMVGVDLDLPQRLRELIVFYMAGLATLTLLINGLTCKQLCLYLKLVDKPPIKEKLLRNAKQQMYLQTLHKKETISQDKYLNFARWDEVDSLVGIQQLKQQIDIKEDKRQSRLSDTEQGRATTYGGMNPEEVHSECRFRMLRTLKSMVWERYEKGHTSGEATQILDYALDMALDQTTQPIALWQNIYENYTQVTMLRSMFKMKDWPLLGNLSKSYITRHLALIYEASTTFVLCMNETVEIQESSPFKNTWINKILHEFEIEIESGEKYLTELMDEFENIVVSIHTKRAAMELLEYHKRFISSYHSKGYIDDIDFSNLQNEIDRRIVNLENHVFNWKPADFRMFIMEFPIFKSLDAKQQQLVQVASKEIQYPVGATIFKQGECSVKEESKSSNNNVYSVTHGIGSLLNYGNLVFQKFNVSTCIAQSNVTVRAIEFETIKKLIDGNPKFEEKVYKGALPYCVRCHMKTAKELGELTETKINQISNDPNTKLHILSAGSAIDCTYGAYLYSGEAIKARTSVSDDNAEDVAFEAYSYISPNNENLVARKRCYILVFSEVIKKHKLMEQFEIDVERKYETQNVQSSAAYIPPEHEQDTDSLQQKLI